MNTPRIETDELLKPAEAAAILFVDPKTVTRWAIAGKVTSIRTPGGHRRFLKSEILELVRGVNFIRNRPPGTPSDSTPPPAPLGRNYENFDGSLLIAHLEDAASVVGEAEAEARHAPTAAADEAARIERARAAGEAAKAALATAEDAVDAALRVARAVQVAAAEVALWVSALDAAYERPVVDAAPAVQIAVTPS